MIKRNIEVKANDGYVRLKVKVQLEKGMTAIHI